MIQIFAFGSSSVYGVGAEQGGWVDLLKQKFHQTMFAPQGEGEKYEVYNFAHAGAPVEFVAEVYPWALEHYGRNGVKVALVSVGGNNSKAEDEPDNFVSTPEEYSAQMRTLLTGMKEAFDHVLFVGGGYVDESKTNPKPNPLTGGCSYFSNERRAVFDTALRQVCDDLAVKYIDLDVDETTWVNTYLYEDGLHSNQQGHELLAKKVWTELQPLVCE